VLAFDSAVQLPSLSDGCYSRQLALATSANKEVLEDFVTGLPSHSKSRAVYSIAFQRAFQLFAATFNSSESTTRKKGKTINMSIFLKIEIVLEVDMTCSTVSISV